MHPALDHFLAHALERHLARFDSFFPPSFDWERLCSDVPALRRAALEATPDREAGDAGLDDPDLEDRARASFRVSYVLGLALLAVADDDAQDPEMVLDALARRPEDETEAAFDALVATGLEAAEELLGGVEPTPPPDESATEAAARASAVWPSLAEGLVGELGAAWEEVGEAADVLWSVARVALLLATLRVMAAEEPE